MSAQRRVRPLRAILQHGLAPVTVVSANFAAGCVGLFAPFGVAITTLGLDWLHFWDVQMPILYGASALSLVSLSYTAWRYRQPLLLVLSVVSVGGLLYPLHDAMDVTVFRLLLNGGATGLLGATVWDVVLSRGGRAMRWRRSGRPPRRPESDHPGRHGMIAFVAVALVICEPRPPGRAAGMSWPSSHSWAPSGSDCGGPVGGASPSTLAGSTSGGAGPAERPSR